MRHGHVAEEDFMRVLVSSAIALFLFGSLGCGGGPKGSTGASASRKGVILLRYKVGSESTEQREQGFLDTLEKEYPDIRILVRNEYSGTTPELSLDKAQTLLTKYEKQVEGIFAVCEPNSTGVLEALKNRGLEGKVKFIAFDPAPQLIEGLADNFIHGIVLQDPVTMGYKAVKTLVDHLEGKKVEKRIATGEYVATPENMNGKDAAGNDVKLLLNPIQFSDEQIARPKEVKYRIAAIPKGTTHIFWKSVHAGAERAARELGNVVIEWQGPLDEKDTEGQINVVQNFVSSKVHGICLAPNDSTALVDSVKLAKSNGIPVVIFDSGLSEDCYVSYVATDNYHGGVLAARRLAEVLGYKPKEEPKKQEGK
jgi:ABC-type sugar transport system substrate-binding protein